MKRILKKALSRVVLTCLVVTLCAWLTSCSSVSDNSGFYLDQAVHVLQAFSAEPTPAQPATSAPAVAPNTQSMASSTPAMPPAPAPQKAAATAKPAATASAKPAQPAQGAGSKKETQAVHVMLENKSSSSVKVEMTDQYGGMFSAEIDGGMSQNHTLRNGSEVKVGGAAIHIISAGDQHKTIVVAK